MLYLLQVNVGLILFYALYKLVCTRDTFFRSRRFILIVSLVLPFILPFIDVREWLESRDRMIMLTHFDYSAVLPEIVVGSEAVETGNRVFVLSEWIGYLYLAGVVVLLVRLAVQAFSLYRLIVRMPEKEINGVRIKCLNDPSGPFSFFGWIFMNPAAVKEDEISEILTHEMAHVKQHHSVDVLLAEMVSICCWMNPFAWLLKREVRLNLEFLADRKVMEAGFATKSYQYHLLGLAYNHKYGLSNNFNFSHLKQRIIMMNKKKSNATGHIKYALFVLPAFALLVAGNISCSQDASQTEDAKEEVVAPVSPEAKEAPADSTAKEEVFMVAEQMPEFPGGMKELLKFLQDNLKYPENAMKNNVQGRVIVQFVVEKDGTLTEFKVARSVDPDLDAEALRVLQTMPKWKPGMQRGKIVRVKFTVPVSFKLQ
ncbi:M56 family metallopeptidase [Phocaeicola plebeius]|jgi:TonB family protein|uniref:M56 family peptidase n=1 Tax=Phocaeicola plebeius TaxID=310297 RepID=A0A415TH26_9BACT|nr:M56 family metallopeptidase [Phocaeicola plebeius]MBS4810698.1 M56 family metallopeptidase [Bacteroides sp.]MBS4825530.1 M56 family metallopeptidase [Bacteroides sp.]RHA29124.1 M56 family peptidase [Phocaeicola plebeius]RHA33223.1 M56 family peptidase [Phocaeicola plebeius]RHN00619.1 M56 family peptidase [Phocaeicola plebeius]